MYLHKKSLKDFNKISEGDFLPREDNIIRNQKHILKKLFL